MNTYEIVNPSDMVLVQAEDELVAAVAVLVLGEGRYGLRRSNGDLALPIFFGGGDEEWLAEKGVPDLRAWMIEHATELAAVYESAFYGDLRELRALDVALARFPDPARTAARVAYNDAKRSSMNDIGKACAWWAAKVRELAGAVEEGRVR